MEKEKIGNEVLKVFKEIGIGTHFIFAEVTKTKDIWIHCDGDEDDLVRLIADNLYAVPSNNKTRTMQVFLRAIYMVARDAGTWEELKAFVEKGVQYH